MKKILLIIMLLFSLIAIGMENDTQSNVIYSGMSSDGWSAGSATTDKVGFHGTAPTAQRSDASQTAITDSSTGTASNSFAEGIGISTISFPVDLATITANGDVITDFTLGYKFKILSIDFVVDVPVTTGSKSATFYAEIGSTATTGGSLALTSATCTPQGAVLNDTAITANNTGASTDTISIIASPVTAFSEGGGSVQITIQNMDTADGAATIADKWNEIRSSLVNKGLIKGSN